MVVDAPDLMKEWLSKRNDATIVPYPGVSPADRYSVWVGIARMPEAETLVLSFLILRGTPTSGQVQGLISAHHDHFVGPADNLVAVDSGIRLKQKDIAEWCELNIPVFGDNMPPRTRHCVVNLWVEH